MRGLQIVVAGVVRYDALHWLMLQADDVIMDTETRRQFIAFGRALRRMISP